jgi:hypothetical protein
MRLRSAYSFESDLQFKEAVKMFNAMEDWVHKPNLNGRWLVRDNDRWGDYLSYCDHDKTNPSIVRTVSLFFDTVPRQVTFGVSRDPNVSASDGEMERAWREHQAYVLDVLLPSLGARNAAPSDFER